MAQKGYHHMTQVQRCSIEGLLSIGMSRRCCCFMEPTSALQKLEIPPDPDALLLTTASLTGAVLEFPSIRL
jgi:hypothetical protein